MTEFEGGVFLTQNDCRTLHPRAGLEADQHVFRHRILPAMNWIAAAWHEACADVNAVGYPEAGHNMLSQGPPQITIGLPLTRQRGEGRSRFWGKPLSILAPLGEGPTPASRTGGFCPTLPPCRLVAAGPERAHGGSHSQRRPDRRSGECARRGRRYCIQRRQGCGRRG